MTQVEPGIWETTLSLLEGTFVPYKYTRGSWDKVESWGTIVGFTNRNMTVTYGTTGLQLVDDTSLDPNTPDDREAIRAWFDIPLPTPPVQVTWRVRVPANTPADATVYMPGSIPALGPWDPAKVAMTQVEPGIWETTLAVPDGTVMYYKYTRGSWETVESWGTITGNTSRNLTVAGGTTGTQLVDDTSTNPNTPDDHEAIGAWIDIA